jgi:microcystin-dependent protein
MDFAGPSVPAGWIACDGAAISRASFPALFAAIGGTWGSGDGSTTFNVPNLINRFRRHRDNGGTSGGVGTLQASQNQTHSHTYSGNTGGHSADHTHFLNVTSGAADRDHTHGFSGTTGSMNRSNPHSHPFNRGGVNTSTTGGGGFGVMASLVGDNTGNTDINHEHAFSGNTGGFSTNHFHNVQGWTGGVSSDHSHGFSGTTSGGSADGAEARPLSATVLTCIKAYN